MTDQIDWLAERFEENRDRLRAVAYRMLGSATEAEDAVQEAWLRLSRSESAEIANLGGWLTTVVSRVCLDTLRSRTSRREDSLAAQPSDPPAGHKTNPEYETALAESVGLALLVVLDRLAPVERIAFVLHDLFAIPFEEIASILGRTPAATRQLASRARRRVHGDPAPAKPSATDPARRPAVSSALAQQRRLVESFLTALRSGDVETLISLLDPGFVTQADLAALPPGVSLDVQGVEAWARQAINVARGAVFARPALIDGIPGLIVAPRGKLFRALNFTFRDDKIAQIDVIADPTRLQALDLAILPAE